jgi:hypothetical protein
MVSRDELRSCITILNNLETRSRELAERFRAASEGLTAILETAEFQDERMEAVRKAGSLLSEAGVKDLLEWKQERGRARPVPEKRLAGQHGWDDQA